MKTVPEEVYSEKDISEGCFFQNVRGADNVRISNYIILFHAFNNVFDFKLYTRRKRLIIKII